MKREYVICNNCKSDCYRVIGKGIDFEYLTSSEEFKVVRCCKCRLIYLQNRPAITEFDKIYPKNYYSYSCVDKSSNENSLSAKYRKKIYKGNFQKVLNLLPNKKVKILDIGCGDGRLLNWFKEMNPTKHECYGVDNNKKAQHIVEKNGHKFFYGIFEDVDLSEYKFDIITSNHVIEHVSNPFTFIQKSISLLNKGGVITFDTPNIDSWEWKFVRKRYWGGYHFPRHFTFYTEDSVRKLLEKSGLEVVSITYYPNPVFHNWTIHHFLSERKYFKFLAKLFPPITIFKNNLYSFVLLSCLTILDIIGQKTFKGKPANMKIIAKRKEDVKKDIKTAEKSFSRYITSFCYNLKYIFNIRKPIMVYRVGRNFLLANLLRKTYPRTLDLNITSKCNLNCDHCFATSFLSKKDKIKPLTIGEYRTIVDQAIKMGFTTLTLTGGEPFINDDIYEIIRNIYPEKVWIACATNGTLCTREKLLEAKKAGLDCIYVSIDSLDPHKHDKFRGGVQGTLVKAMAALEDALSIGLKAAINTTIIRQDVYEKNFREIIDFAKKRKMLLLLNLAAPAGKWMKHEELYFRYEDTVELNKILRKNPHVRTDMEANYLEWGCPSFKERLYVTNFGDVLPCPFIHISFGNIREERLDRIIKQALKFPVFKNYQPLCLASQDVEFIQKFIYPTFKHTIRPVHYSFIFKDKFEKRR
ncbi:methyltransferase domain-containing protein [Patescibacteria group bacterium]|nr:methyltransferase domain-containing protein [Patescibacteria group bacterium]